MRILVCGSREWTDREIVDRVLDGYLWMDDHEMVVIEGGAKGADTAAYEWFCRNSGNTENPAVRWEQYPADWEKHGKAAGPIRNQRMLDEGKPDVVIAFKDGFQRYDISTSPGGPVMRRRGGTEDLCRRAKAMGIPVYVVSHG